MLFRRKWIRGNSRPTGMWLKTNASAAKFAERREESGMATRGE
jgi:hypothetical protein